MGVVTRAAAVRFAPHFGVSRLGPSVGCPADDIFPSFTRRRRGDREDTSLRHPNLPTNARQERLGAMRRPGSKSPAALASPSPKPERGLATSPPPTVTHSSPLLSLITAIPAAARTHVSAPYAVRRHSGSMTGITENVDLFFLAAKNQPTVAHPHQLKNHP